MIPTHDWAVFMGISACLFLGAYFLGRNDERNPPR